MNLDDLPEDLRRGIETVERIDREIAVEVARRTDPRITRIRLDNGLEVTDLTRCADVRVYEPTTTTHRMFGIVSAKFMTEVVLWDVDVLGPDAVGNYTRTDPWIVVHEITAESIVRGVIRYLNLEPCMTPVLRMGMVGGGRGAFIGAVHRTAACLDNQVSFVAGCLSSLADKAIASGQDLGLDARRNYKTWEEMLSGELALPPGERIDFVSIVTPNHVHHPVAKAFAAAGIHVVCDKPLCHTSAQARDLAETAKKSGVVFAVTYNYTGYPMVKQAREMIRQGEIGDIRKVIVEYNQGWLASQLEATGQKQADWRTDPSRSGAGGAIGDIGSHAEQLVSYTTGLEIESICADLTSFVPGRKLDDDANLLIRYAPRTPGGIQAKGILTASQIEIGHENDLRLRIYGTKGTLIWHQENPNYLSFRLDGRAEQIYTRGSGYLGDAAKKNTRLPGGHPEAFLEAFANVYNAAGEAIRAKSGTAGAATSTGGLGAAASGGGGGVTGSTGFDFPTILDGARGVHFIEKTVESSKSDRKWTGARFSMA